MWGNQGGFSGYGGDSGGGGGFMSSPGFNSPQAGPSGDRQTKRSRASSLIPCSVADIIHAENADGSYRIAGGRAEAGQVSLIGLVKAVRELETRIEYEIDDCTGPVLDIRQFIDPEDTGEARSKPYPENTYIQVFGTIRDIGGKRMVAAFKVQPVDDMNKLTAHLLEIVYSRLNWIKGKDEQNMNMDTSVVKREAGGGGSFNQGGGETGGFYTGFTKAQVEVHRRIQSNTTENGISIHQLTSDCHGLSQRDIRDAIDYLSAEGHIYSTVDDDHFRTTDS